MRTSDFSVASLRNDFVINIVKSREKDSCFLDVGCGSGELACAVARLGIAATGVDFAPQLIEKAKQTAKVEKLSKAHFFCKSIFELKLDESSYDVISANGFTDYISYLELEKFLALVNVSLKKNGLLVLGIRNRLFNLVAMNDCTLQELDTSTFPDLIREAVAISSGSDLMELLEICAAPVSSCKPTIDSTSNKVQNRSDYTPVQMLQVLTRHGFCIRQLYPINIHSAAPLFKNKYPHVHAQVANLLQPFASENMSLLPFASTFMVLASRG